MDHSRWKSNLPCNPPASNKIHKPMQQYPFSVQGAFPLCPLPLRARLSDGLDSSLVLQTVRNLRVWCEEMQAVVVAVLLQPPPEVSPPCLLCCRRYARPVEAAARRFFCCTVSSRHLHPCKFNLSGWVKKAGEQSGPPPFPLVNRGLNGPKAGGLT